MPDYDIILISVTGVVTMVMAVISILHKNLIRAIVCFAVASVGLAALFFLLESPYAGVLELMVGAGLVAVLFLVAFILAGGEEQEALV